MRVVAGVTEEGEYQGVEGDRAVLGDLDLREGREKWHNNTEAEVHPKAIQLKWQVCPFPNRGTTP